MSRPILPLAVATAIPSMLAPPTHARRNPATTRTPHETRFIRQVLAPHIAPKLRDHLELLPQNLHGAQSSVRKHSSRMDVLVEGEFEVLPQGERETRAGVPTLGTVKWFAEDKDVAQKVR